jgi:negative regulator of sigma E activity
MAGHWQRWHQVRDAMAAQAAFLKSHADVLGQAASLFPAADEV